MMKKALQLFIPTAEAIQRLLHPHVEVVIHDLQKNEIAAIFHPFSKRRVGDSSMLSPEESMASLGESIGPYEKLNWDGRKLKAVSSIIRDEKNQAVGMLCINLDVSALTDLNQLLQAFIHSEQSIPQPAPLFKDDWKERLNQYIHDYLNQNHLRLETLQRAEKKKLIEHLQEIGAFTGKNSAFYVAQILKVSRATVYNYLSNFS